MKPAVTKYSHRQWLVLLAILLSAGAFFFSTGLTGFRPLVWIAPIPVLLLSFNSQARISAIAAFTAYFLGSLNLLSYLADLAPVPAVLIALIIPAIVFSLSVLANRYVFLRFKPWAALLVFPAAWVTWEYLLATFSPHGTFGNIAYTQTDFLSLMQLVSITGIWGVSFLLMLVPVGITVSLQLFKNDKKQAAAVIIITGVLVSIVCSWGWFRLKQEIPTVRLKVGLAATDETVKYFDTDKAEQALPVVRDYARRIRELAEKGAVVIVLPEKFIGVAPDYSSEVYGILQDAARENNVTVIAGLNFTGNGPQRNTAVIFSPSGEAPLEYDKTHLLAGFESQYKPGEKMVIFPVSESVSGVEICKDMDFPKLSAGYGAKPIGLVFVPAWDFVRDGELHSNMAIVRGIENGFGVVRSAQQGLLTISDDKGRILAEESSSKLPEALLAGEINPGTGRTIYNLTGDWFAWLNILALIVTMTLGVFKRKSFGFQKNI